MLKSGIITYSLVITLLLLLLRGIAHSACRPLISGEVTNDGIGAICAFGIITQLPFIWVEAALEFLPNIAQLIISPFIVFAILMLIGYSFSVVKKKITN